MSDKLQRLQEKRDQLNAQIQSVRAREQAKKRKEDTRKKVLVGAMIMDKVERGEWPKDKLHDALDQYLTRDRDRELFGLPSTKDEARP